MGIQEVAARVKAALDVCTYFIDVEGRESNRLVSIGQDEAISLPSQAQRWVRYDGGYRLVPLWVLARYALGVEVPAPPSIDNVTPWPGEKR